MLTMFLLLIVYLVFIAVLWYLGLGLNFLIVIVVPDGLGPVLLL